MSAKTPYIGSKISLISKAEIRYEGVLYAVDTKEATVTLAKVRSFGTEGRQVPKPIPPRTETYEFIIFRGSDIKDLHVSEIPPKTTEDSAHQDPAIVSATSQAPAPPSAASDAPPPSSSAPSSSQLPLPPPSQPPTYSPFPPAHGGFTPFNVPYFKPQMVLGATGPPATVQRPPHLPPPPAQHSMYPLPFSSHQPFPPFMPGQLPIPLAQKSPFVPPNLPYSSAHLISTIMRPSPGMAVDGKTQSPVASSTPQTVGLEAADTQAGGPGSTTPAQTTPQAASESESPLARMNHVSPPSQVTQAPPPSLLSHVPPSLDSAPLSGAGQTTATSENGNQMVAMGTQTQAHGVDKENHMVQKGGGEGGKAPLISDPPPQMSTERRGSDSGRGGRGRGGRRNSRGGPRRGGGPSNQQDHPYRFENDFDFESANAQFDKEVVEQEFKRLHVSRGKDTPSGSVSDDVGGAAEVEEEAEEVEEGEVVEETESEVVYDRNKSFFDNLGCEKPGGPGNRYNNWNEEKALNTETFGVSSVNRLRRGRGGRGRWRGRGGGWGRGWGKGYGRREYYGRGGGARGGRGGQRDEGRDEGRDSETREDRPARGRGGGGYYHQRWSLGGSGGYRGQGKRGSRGGSGGRGGTVEQPDKPTTTAGGGGEDQ